MPLIIVPRRHLVQPQGRIEPASEYSSARVLALPGCAWSNRGILPAGIPTQAESFGQSWVFNGSSHFIDLGAQPALATSFTIGALVWQGSTINAFAVASRSTASTQGFGLVVGPGSVAGAATCQVGTSGGTYTATPSATGLSARYALHICTLASGTLRHYVDGVLIGSISVAGTNTPSQNLYLARRGTTYFAGRIGLAFELPEALSAERVADLSRAPWQLFRRDPVRLYFDVGGGAPSESGGSSSLIDVTAAGAGTGAEAASGGSASVVDVTSAGSGAATESASGGAASLVEVTAAGAGTKQEAGVEEGGSASVVEVTSAGAGTAAEAAQGGSSSAVDVTAAGAGFKAEEGAESGGSSSIVEVTSIGGGVAFQAASGGAASIVQVLSFGAGSANDGSLLPPVRCTGTHALSSSVTAVDSPASSVAASVRLASTATTTVRPL